MLYCQVYSFPIAALTKYHKPGDLKQPQFICSQFWGLEVQNDGRAMFHLKPKEENLFSLLLASGSRRQSSGFLGLQMPHWNVCHCYLMAIISLCVSLPSYGILSDSLFSLGHSHIGLRTHLPQFLLVTQLCLILQAHGL